MSSQEFHHYTRDEFLGEFFPDAQDQAAITAGMNQLRAGQRAWRLADMRRMGSGVAWAVLGRAEHAGQGRRM